MAVKPNVQVINADALDALKEFADDSIDSLVTDPPSGTGFMGKIWDRPDGVSAPTFDAFRRAHNPADAERDSVFGRTSKTSPHSYGESDRGKFIAGITPIFAECLRVLKPGAHGLVWALPRTQHWTATALEDAGFEVRDCISHFFGSGFPKSLDVSKAIDAAASTSPATAAAREWSGWGTALKPASEQWILVRKPLSEKNIAANVVKHGTGALNIDGCRIGTDLVSTIRPVAQRDGKVFGKYNGGETTTMTGRWPANVVLSHHPLCTVVGERIVKGDPREGGAGRREGGFLDVGSSNCDGAPNGKLYGDELQDVWSCIPGCAVAELDRQSGKTAGSSGLKKRSGSQNGKWGGGTIESPRIDVFGGHNDIGGASRFLYCAKPSTAEKQDALRNLSLFDTNPEMRPDKNLHPTVKPVELMRWLIRLVTPPGGTVLDCFAGSGTTGVAAVLEGHPCIMIEREAASSATALARVERAQLGAA